MGATSTFSLAYFLCETFSKHTKSVGTFASAASCNMLLALASILGNYAADGIRSCSKSMTGSGAFVGLRQTTSSVKKKLCPRYAIAVTQLTSACARKSCACVLTTLFE